MDNRYFRQSRTYLYVSFKQQSTVLFCCRFPRPCIIYVSPSPIPCCSRVKLRTPPRAGRSHKIAAVPIWYTASTQTLRSACASICFLTLLPRHAFLCVTQHGQTSRGSEGCELGFPNNNMVSLRRRTLRPLRSVGDEIFYGEKTWVG